MRKTARKIIVCLISLSLLISMVPANLAFAIQDDGIQSNEEKPISISEANIEKRVIAIAVCHTPTKLIYEEGSDNLDLTGGQIKVYYSDDTTEIIDINKNMVSGFNSTLVGKQELTVTYEGKTTSFEVEITEKMPSAILIERLPYKREYIENFETLNVSGGQIKLLFDDGYPEKVINMTDDMITGFDNSTVGVQTLTVHYGEITTTFEIEVVAKSLSGISIGTKPEKSRYLKDVDVLDLTGGKLTLHYNNGTSDDNAVAITADMVSGFNNTTVGANTLTVTYQDMQTTFDVQICVEDTESFAGGIGSKENPYLIITKEHLNNVRYHLDACFKMLDDITFTDEDFSEGSEYYNSGSGWKSFPTFSGYFDGNGHTIKGLRMSDNKKYIGIFAQNNGTIISLGVENICIKVLDEYSGNTYIGGIVGYNEGEINKCYNYTSLDVETETHVYMGGLVGYNTRVLRDCYNEADIDVTEGDVGGIAGYSSGTVERCYNNGFICGKDGSAGGLVASNYGQIENCYNLNKVEGHRSTGGIAEYNSGKISKCYNKGEIKCQGDFWGRSNAGGISADNNGEIINCYNIGAISTTVGDSGGIIGNNNASGIVSKCYNIGNSWQINYKRISGAERVTGKKGGGIAGFNDGEINNCYFYGMLSEGIGGGLTDSDSITMCTIEDMQHQKTFMMFDFNETWTIEETSSYSFPTLQGMPNVKAPENFIEFAGGNGSVESPFRISTKKQLDNMRKHLGSFFELTDDIEFTAHDFEKNGAFYNNGNGWDPIGYDQVHSFFGQLQGNNYSIKGLEIYNRRYLGLIGFNEGILSEIGMEGCLLQGDGGEAGSLASINNGVIKKCYNTGIISGVVQAGGIAGTNKGEISFCYNVGLISGIGNVGGIVGYNTKGVIYCCYNNNKIRNYYIEDNYPSAGGISGSNYSGKIYDCYNIEEVISENNAGGIVGFNTGIVENAYNIGEIFGENHKGHIIGENQGQIYNCFYLDFPQNNVNTDMDNSTKCTFEEMKARETFLEFNFSGTWTMEGNPSYFFPELIDCPMEVEKDTLYIEIYSLPNKLKYLESKETLNLNDGSIAIYYNNGEREIKEINKEMVSGFNNTKVGPQTLTVSYGGKTATFDIEIIAKDLTGIEILDFPEKTKYLEGIGELDLTGGKILLKYNNGTMEEIDLTEEMVSGFDNTKVGPQTIDIIYGALEDSFQINIIAKSISSVELIEEPIDKIYEYGDGGFSAYGGQIKVNYNNDTYDIINVTNNMVSGFDEYRLGIQTITITYKGETAEYDVNVIPADISSYDVSLSYTKVEYDGTAKYPSITVDGLKQDSDYTVEYMNNIEAGTAQIIITGMGNYQGTITKSFEIVKKDGAEAVLGDTNIKRIFGSSRYETSMKTADAMKLSLGIDKFDTVIVASGDNYADALAGSYLARIKKAPILVVNKYNEKVIKDYITKNIDPNGKIYILGGIGAVSDNFEKSLSHYKIKRLGGANRYETNMQILQESGGLDKGIVVCSALDFADSLSVSSAGKPILLVNNKLYQEQIDFINKSGSKMFYLIGGSGAVSNSVQNTLERYGKTTQRIAGENRFETSVKVAGAFAPKGCHTIVLASGNDFPDGLVGGPLGYFTDSPLILINERNTSAAASYKESANITGAMILGGPQLISDRAANNIMS